MALTTTQYYIITGQAPQKLGDTEIYQTISFTSGLWYYLQYTVSALSAGSLTPNLGGTVGTSVSANGTATESLIAGASHSLLIFTASADFDGKLDSVSLKSITSIDSLADSLDSSVYSGGALNFAAFDDTHKMGFFSGSHMSATVVTGELEMIPNRDAHLNGFRPIVDGGTVTGRVGTRDAQSDSAVFSTALSPNSRDRISIRKRARYHRFRIDITGDFENALGIDFDDNRDIRQAGQR